MTGVVAGCLAAAGVVILVAGTFAALALNSVPLAIAVTGASFGAMGLLGAWARLRGRFRFPRPRPLTGWRLTAAALLSFACGAGSVIAGVGGLVTVSAALAVFGAALGVRCGVAAHLERRCPQHAEAEAEVPWTDEDEEILRGDVSLPAWKRAGQADGSERR